MARKMLIIGSRGMLGEACLRRSAGRALDAVGIDIGEIDIADATSIERVFADVRPDAVINCAAYTDVESCETPEGRALADRVNGDGPGLLAEACLRSGAAFAHISTDYVFNGTSPEGAAESDVSVGAMNAYGETKRVGEERVISAAGGVVGSELHCQDPRIYLVRTSWLFGTSARNFVAKIIARARAEGRVSVVTDEIGCPTYVEDLAEGLLSLFESDARSGIYHMTSSNSCSRFDFASAIIRGLGLAAVVEPTVLAAFPRKARIAGVSVLRNTKRPPLRRWEEMVETYCSETRTI